MVSFRQKTFCFLYIFDYEGEYLETYKKNRCLNTPQRY